MFTASHTLHNERYLHVTIRFKKWTKKSLTCSRTRRDVRAFDLRIYLAQGEVLFNNGDRWIPKTYGQSVPRIFISARLNICTINIRSINRNLLCICKYVYCDVSGSHRISSWHIEYWMRRIISAATIFVNNCYALITDSCTMRNVSVDLLLLDTKK